jgi:hypothetical protein
VNECNPALAIEYADEGVALIACLAHIEPILTILPLLKVFILLATA